MKYSISSLIQHLKPVQLKHGARLVGRWQTDDDRIVAVWEYDSMDAYQAIQQKVVADPDTHKAREIRKTLPPLIVEQEEVFMKSTVTCRSAAEWQTKKRDQET